MGKKSKRTADASTSHGSQKRTKTQSQLPSPPRPSLPTVKYEDMPPNHKRKFYIDDDCGSLKKYIELITWLRTMSSFDGSVFDGIPNLNYCGQGYPLLEVEVITPNDNSAKFIITKMTLYLIAFSAYREWVQFGCEYMISSFAKMEGFDGSYTTEPWENIGPKSMIEAVDFLATHKLDLSRVDDFVEACEVFFVHLCEAARLCPVESVVCKSLVPKAGRFDKRTYEDEESMVLKGENDEVIERDQDVYILVVGDGPVNSELFIPTPNYLQALIKKFGNISKYWFVYSLSGKRWFEIPAHDVSRFHLRSVKSLRCTLGVLCNTNLRKVLDEWKKKSQTHGIITREVYKEMEEKVLGLHSQNKVLFK